MVDKDNIISVIRDNNSFKNNLENDFCYKIYNNDEGEKLQVILSNKNVFSKHLINGQNIVILFSNDTKQEDKFSKIENTDKQLVQYVYYCNSLSIADVRLINEAIMEIDNANDFINPL